MQEQLLRVFGFARKNLLGKIIENILFRLLKYLVQIERAALLIAVDLLLGHLPDELQGRYPAVRPVAVFGDLLVF